MGFTDTEKMLKALKLANGNVDDAVDYLDEWVWGLKIIDLVLCSLIEYVSSILLSKIMSNRNVKTALTQLPEASRTLGEQSGSAKSHL